eukprot:1536842-Pyramimonas_sp.AAC.1
MVLHQSVRDMLLTELGGGVRAPGLHGEPLLEPILEVLSRLRKQGGQNAANGLAGVVAGGYPTQLRSTRFARRVAQPWAPRDTASSAATFLPLYGGTL